ncbi:MAG: hypothetical protein U0470_05085 [Anaerolineae bacterium]
MAGVTSVPMPSPRMNGMIGRLDAQAAVLQVDALAVGGDRRLEETISEAPKV